MKSLIQICLLSLSTILLGCYQPDTFYAKYNRDNCTITFEDSVWISKIELSQANMMNTVRLVFKNKKVSYIKTLSVCSPDTNLYEIQNKKEYLKMNFDNNFLVWIYLVDQENLPKDIFDDYVYRRYMHHFEKDKKYNDQKIKFRTTRP